MSIATPHAGSEHFHPLEIIPWFRRWPRTPARDLLYTLIWSSFFGFGVYGVTTIAAGELPAARVFALQMTIATCCGYAIHFLYFIGDRSGLEAVVRRLGVAGRVAYYAGIPVVGVVAGFVFAALLMDNRLLDLLARPNLLLSILVTSLFISLVLSAIFFWRERAALGEAAAAMERARVERVEREAALANLRALQAQIEPHFLFNTLANVGSLIDPDPAKAKHMLESFIRFLRGSLAATRAESTTLGDESQLIAAYLDVLKVRMGARLEYGIDVPHELRAQPLPPMLLQPLVENAIRHGLEPKVEGGRVTFTARGDGDSVRIEIADTGVGFAPVTRGGIGLGNLRERLALLYPGRSQLDIGENAPAGTRVTVTIPR